MHGISKNTEIANDIKRHFTNQSEKAFYKP